MRRITVRIAHEDGVALVVALGVMLVLSFIAAAVLVTATASNTNSLQDRRGKVALAGALTGLRTGLYRLNTGGALDNQCPDTSAPVNGLCVSSSSDSGQPAPNESWKVWVTPTLRTNSNPRGSTADICTGSTSNATFVTGATVRERCITALGQALDPSGAVTATRRVQIRVASSGPLFPVPGIWGTDCVQVGKGGSGAVIFGAIGSNGSNGACKNDNRFGSYDIDVNVSTWGDSASTRIKDGKEYHMGGDVYFGRGGPNNNALPSAQLVYGAVASVGDPTFFPPTLGAPPLGSYTLCDPATCPTGKSGGSGPCSLNATSATKTVAQLCTPDQDIAQPRDMGVRTALRPVGPLFLSPPQPRSQAYGGTDAAGNPINPVYGCATAAEPVGCASPATATPDLDVCQDATSQFETPARAPCDSSRKNNNSTAGAIAFDSGCDLSANKTQYNAGTPNPSTGIPPTRSLSLTALSNSGTPCTATLKNGVYNFCSITLSKNTRIEPADTSLNAEVYIFIDSNTRTVLRDTPGHSDGSACASGSGVGNVSIPTGSGSDTSFMRLGTTSLAGQLYFWGDGDSVGNVANVTHTVQIPNGWVFRGIVYAPNSVVSLKPGSTLQGGLTGRGVVVENNATYAWDQGVLDVDPDLGRVNYQVSQFTICSRTVPVVAGTEYPMDEC